ncbi:hypothetical protein MTO96_012069 [Rhipicephalus appendiculatus]
MIYFVVGVSLLLGSPSSVLAQGLQINGPECGIPTRGMIVNGSFAGPNQFPWMVYLDLLANDGAGYFCAGSILTRRHILTAAHCTEVEGEPVVKIDAYYGNPDRTRGRMLRVTKMIRHPRYERWTLYSDIAILVVEKPFQYGSNARPLCIPVAPMNILGTETILAGWGRLIEGGNSTKHLQYTTVKVVPNEKCMDQYLWRYYSDVMYCAYRSGTDSCKGDSGGPAIIRVKGGRYVQVGIVSYGHGCARDEVPGVYARVDVFTPWIKHVVSTSVKAYTSEVPLQPPSYTVLQWPFIFQFP